MATYEQVTYNSADGAQIGKSATEKVAFFGITPVVQPTAAAQAALALTTAKSSGYGFTTATAFNAFTAHLASIRTALVALGIIKGS